MAQVTPTWRDPWAWLSSCSVLLLVHMTNGAPRGEPVAEDFDFLHRALLERGFTLLNGGGSDSFWRPVSHQLYYETLGSLALTHPGWVSAAHIAMLAVSVLLLYRVFRAYWDAPSAAAVATFPLFAESTRTLICWPSHFVDVGAFLFLVIAVHERVFNRQWSSWGALLCALLSKELALIGAILLPFVPNTGDGRLKSRAYWMAGTGIVIVAWAFAYTWVRAHAGLELPHGIERDAALLNTPLPTRLWWAIWNSARAAFSLSLTPSNLDLPAGLLGVVLGASALIMIGRDAERQRALVQSRRWIVWGAIWCLVSWAALATIYPLWAPNRSQLGSVGLGIALVALLRVAHPTLVAALVICRTLLFLGGPVTPAVITPEAPQRGAFMDYSKLVRLQKLMADSRARLKAFDPHPVPRTIFGWYNLPLSSEYAFGGSKAVQVWYQDPTLGFVSNHDFAADTTMAVKAFISYQAPPLTSVVIIDASALRAQMRGASLLEAGDWKAAISMLNRSDSLESDPNAQVFFGDNAGRRATALVQLRMWDQAEQEARKALRVAREDVGARLALATVLAIRHDRTMAIAELDTLLARSPGDREARDLLNALRSGVLRDSNRSAQPRQ